MRRLGTRLDYGGQHVPFLFGVALHGGELDLADRERGTRREERGHLVRALLRSYEGTPRETVDVQLEAARWAAERRLL